MSENGKEEKDFHVNMGFSGDHLDKGYGATEPAGDASDTAKVVAATTTAEGGEKVEERGNWDNKCDFFLSALGYAVGLGNVWRFPFLAYKHGGGSFLLPYSVMLLFAGLPLFFLELALGQYSGAGPTRLFGRLAPIMKGLGFGMLVATFFVSIYYNVIIAWAIHYLFSGMAAKLPWSDCGDFNSTRCLDANVTAAAENVTCAIDNSSASGSPDIKPYGYMPDMSSKNYSAPEYYFNHVVLGLDMETITWDNFGGLQWPLVGCLFAAWVIVGGSLIKGVQSSGKVVYFTAIFPFVVLVILFFRVIFLEGASEGIRYYLTPDWNKLQAAEAWQDAATQIFYSLGPAFGGLITLASYNKFDNNCHRDAVLIAFCNCATSVFAGFVVFSILGFMAHTAGVCISEVADGGPSLAFIVFPEAVAQMGGAQFWAFIFFFMLITLGLDSMFTNVETLTTAILDHFKSLRTRKELVVIATCATGFLFGLSMVSKGGMYMFTLIDSTCASWNILLFAFLELFLVTWMYGTDRFVENLEEMGIRLWGPIKWYWILCWQAITPLILIVLVVQQFKNGMHVEYEGHVFPSSVQSLGWLISLSSVVMIPLLAARQIIRRYRKGKKLGFALYKSTPKWMPATKIIGN